MESVFEKFGGIRPMADKVGVPPSTVKTWHRKRAIPEWRIDRVMEAALHHGVSIQRAEVECICADSKPLRKGAPPISTHPEVLAAA